jgi:Cof subfamily protein (haloacid dehalogenase superfamily)
MTLANDPRGAARMRPSSTPLCAPTSRAAAHRPRVVALDLDGTLLASDGSVSARNSAAVRACAGRDIRPVIASARPPRSVAALLPPDFPAVTWICYNGAEVWHAGRRIIHRAIAPEHAHALLAVIETHAPAATISAEFDDQLYANRPLRQPWEHSVVDLRAAITQPVSKILFAADEVPDLAALRAALPEEYSVCVTDRGCLGHIMAPGVSKALALAALLDRVGLSLADVIAFGDDHNDLELIAAAGTGVAMGNAIADLKAVATHVTATNDQDGVAAVLEAVLAALPAADGVSGSVLSARIGEGQGEPER